MDSHTYRQLNFPLLLKAGIQAANGFDDSQACADRTLGVVFVGLRVSKIYEQTIPQVLRDVPTKPANDLVAGILIPAYDFAQVLRVQLS